MGLLEIGGANDAFDLLERPVEVRPKHVEGPHACLWLGSYEADDHCGAGKQRA